MWETRIIAEADSQTLTQQVRTLIEHQKKTWPALSKAYQALAKVETRCARIGAGSKVIIQHNPGRIQSTAARIDKATIENRPCQLCPDNLPPQEKGISYGENFIILCNPFPVLDRHLSIVHREHVEQKLEGNLEVLLALARDLSPDYFVSYNGPECGASAPDHLHFQACSCAILPIERDLCDRASARKRRRSLEVFLLAGCGRSVIVFRGHNQGELVRQLYKALEELSRQTGKRPEPMVNLVCTYRQGSPTLYLFPRLRHRPSCFYAEGEAKLTVSPGAIDMAGIIVVPERDHFARLDATQIEQIFSEVSLSDAIARAVVQKIAQDSP
jgi:hypothetical protein